MCVQPPFFEVKHSKPIVYNPLSCNYCTLCEEICPVAAIELPYLVCRANNEIVPYECLTVIGKHKMKPYTLFTQSSKSDY